MVSLKDRQEGSLDYFLISGVWVGKRIATALAYISDFQGKISCQVDIYDLFNVNLQEDLLHFPGLEWRPDQPR